MALIMIVDDDPHIRMALRRIIESIGHSTIEAGNGQDAIEMFQEFRPDLVITDIFMPEVDGIETIRAIRRCQPGARVIAMSGGHFDGDWNHLGSVVVLGADLALAKPFTGAQLTNAIDLLLAREPADPLGAPTHPAVAP